MGFIESLKGVFRKMFSNSTIEEVLHIQPTISTKMKDAIELWELMYKNESPWLEESPTNTVRSLGLASMIASEKARTATIEMEIKVTGDSERAEFMKGVVDKINKTIRKQLEYGIALGGIVVKPYVMMGANNKYKIGLNYVKAVDFYPLAFSSEGDVIEAAFVDRIITKDDIYSKVEWHKLVGTTLTIQSKAFIIHNRQMNNVNTTMTELGNEIPLTDVAEWAEITPTVIIKDVDGPMFAYFKMPQSNTIDLNSPLGVSGFSKAVDLIKDADKIYSDLLWEFEGGQLAVDVDRTALNPIKDKDGRPIEILPQRQERLFRHTLDLGTDETYNVFNPDLRDENYIRGLNNVLMHIEDVCEISRGSVSEVTYAEARTATEMRILKQRSFAANADIQKELQNTLEKTIDIVDKYCDLYSIVPRGDYEIAYKWDDSIIVDKDTERETDLLDVNNGLLSKVEYRMKWLGETEVQAEEALKKINEEKQAEIELNNNVMFGLNNTTGSTTEAEASYNKKSQSNASNETSKND